MKAAPSLELVKRIKALADTGLVYAADTYDKERYKELGEISLELMAIIADRPLRALKGFYMPVVDYPTVKVDVRALVLNEEYDILMVKESTDDKWTIPGGWADVGDTPSEAVLKAIFEETGLKAEAVRLLSVYDKRCHPHPPQPFYVYKLIFLCKIIGGTLQKGFDIKDICYHPIKALPTLSKDRILESQLEQLHKMVVENDTNVYFD